MLVHRPLALRLCRTFTSSHCYASTLVIAEHFKQHITSSSLSAITAGCKIQGKIDLAIFGKDIKKLGDVTAKMKNVESIFLVESPIFEKPVAENVAQALLVLQKKKNYTHIIAPNSSNGKSYLPRLASLLDVSPLTDILSIHSEDTFTRAMYAGNAIAKIVSKEKIKIFTVRATSFPCASVSDSGSTASIELVENIEPAKVHAEYVKEDISTSVRPDLTSAKVVVAGGRGLQSKDNFKMLENLADKLKGTVGGTRAAVDAGYISNDMQIGQTGKIIAPDVYIAAGISGAIQHVCGIKDAKTIICINKDEDAPIFQVADYGIVGDLFKVIPELSEKL